MNSQIITQTYPRRRPLGQRPDLDPSMLSPDEVELNQGFFMDAGIYSSQDLGTGAYLNTNAMAFEIYRPVRFRTSLGTEYELAFTSDGKIIYTITSSNFADFHATTAANYIETADGTALVFESGVTGAPHIIPVFITRGSNDVLVSNGIDTVYRIDGSTWPTSGKLKALPVSTLSPFLFGGAKMGRTIVSDGEAIYITSPMDPNRCYSIPSERADKIWDDNHWYAPAGEGVSGHITAIKDMDEASWVVATTDGIFRYFLDTGGHGQIVENLIPLVTGVGCPNGAICSYMGTVLFASDYGGGGIYGLKRGAPSESEGNVIDTESKYGWVLFEAAPGLRAMLALVRPSDFGIKHCGVLGSRSDWEKAPALARENLNVEKDNGWIYIDSTATITFTAQIAVKTTGNAIHYWGTGGWTPGYSSSHMDWNVSPTTPYDTTQLYNGVPTYPATTPDSNTFTLFNINNAVPPRNYIKDISIRSDGIDGPKLKNEMNQLIKVVANKTGWTSYTFKELVRTGTLVIDVEYYTGSGSVGSMITQIAHQYIIINLGGVKNLGEIRIFGWNRDIGIGPSGDLNATVRCHQIMVVGADSTTASYFGNRERVTGLTASSNLEFGLIRSVFRCLSEDKYPAISVRVGNAARGDSVGTSTLSAAITAGDTSCTVVATTGLAEGDNIYVADGGGTAEYKEVAKISGLTVYVKTAFLYNHANGTATTYYGGGGATWSAWTTLTLAELRVGKKIRDLTINGSAPTSDSSGYFWTQFKAVLTLDTKTGLSPAVNIVKFDFITGSLKLSNHIMHAVLDDHVVYCAPELSGSTENDITFVHNTALGKSGSMFVRGQHINAIVKNGGDFIVQAGRKIAKLWNGDYNYVGTSSTDTALTRRLKFRKERGRATQGQGFSLDIIKHNETVLTPRTAAATIDSDAYRLYNRGAAPATYQPWGSSANAYGLRNQLTEAVNTGDAVFWLHPTGPSAVNQTALYLLRFKDGAVTTVKTLVASSTNYCGGDMAWDGEYLWIAYWSYTSPFSAAVYKVTKYNPVTGASHDYAPMTNLTAGTAYVCFGLCIKYLDGVVHLQACMYKVSGGATESWYTNSRSAFATATAVPVALISAYEYPMWIEDHLGCLQLVQMKGVAGTSSNTGELRGCRLVSVASDGTPTWSTDGVLSFASLAAEQINNYCVRYDAALGQYLVFYSSTTEYTRIYTGTSANVWTRRDSGNTGTVGQLKITRLSNGHLLLLYLKRDSALYYYRIWDGSTLGAATSTAIAGPNSTSQAHLIAADNPDIIMWLCFNNAATPLMQVYEVRNYELLGDSGMLAVYLNTDTEQLPIDVLTSPAANVKLPESGLLPVSGDTKTLQIEVTTDVPCVLGQARLSYREMEPM